MKIIVAATNNKGKVAEFRDALARLGFDIKALAEFPPVAEAVEDGETFEANALIKAQYYAQHTGCPCLADDSGLEVDALDGAPGVYSARYAGDAADDAANNRKLLAALEGVPQDRRTARFRCVLAFVDTQGMTITTDGSCEGIILTAQRGQGGFGYDPLFYMPELGKTLAEVTLEEKNKVSHRGKALRSMAAKLQGTGL